MGRMPVGPSQLCITAASCRKRHDSISRSFVGSRWAAPAAYLLHPGDRRPSRPGFRCAILLEEVNYLGRLLVDRIAIPPALLHTWNHALLHYMHYMYMCVVIDGPSIPSRSSVREPKSSVRLKRLGVMFSLFPLCRLPIYKGAFDQREFGKTGVKDAFSSTTRDCLHVIRPKQSNKWIQTDHNDRGQAIALGNRGL